MRLARLVRGGSGPTIDPEHLAEPGDHDVLCHAQAEQAGQRAKSAEPEVQRDTRNHDQQGCHAQLKRQALHDRIMGLSGPTGKGATGTGSGLRLQFVAQRSAGSSLAFAEATNLGGTSVEPKARPSS